MLAAIESARETVGLESYIFAACDLTLRFRDALCRAADRGLQVRILVDSFGSFNLPAEFWDPVLHAGGAVRWFNPFTLGRFGFRNHRKLVVCDREVAIIGGFNLSSEWEGNGVTHGWSDLGAVVRGKLALKLAHSFDEMFERADLRHRWFWRLRRNPADHIKAGREELLLGGPGRGHSPILESLRRDFRLASSVRLVAAYFLPPRFVRRALIRVARSGGTAALVLPGHSDIPLAKMAAQLLYARLLRQGVQIYEYEPQILHAKFMLIDQALYLGSANLDRRSFHINYELLVRIQNGPLAAEARQVFEGYLRHSRRVDLQQWRSSRTLWRRWRDRWAYWVLTRLDPFVARQQMRWMR